MSAPAEEGWAEPDRLAEIGAYLAQLDAPALRTLLLDAAGRDDRLCRLVLLRARSNRPSVDDEDRYSSLRDAIDEASDIEGFVTWREAGSLADTLDDIVAALALMPRACAALIDLVEHAIVRIETMMEQVDDSGGQVGCVVERLGALHLEACGLARHDPVLLAARLWRMGTTLPFGICSFDFKSYRETLGAEGLRHYQELAWAAWGALNGNGAPGPNEAQRAVITRIMVGLAEDGGDVAQLVEIKAADLSCAYRYLDIAKIWAGAGQQDKALEWAERGLKAFPHRPDNQLRDFLAAAYFERGRGIDALQLIRIQFDERPSLEHYQKLSDMSGKLGLWSEQRQRVLDMVAAAMDGGTGWKGAVWISPRSLRVAIAMWEQDMNGAFDFARHGQCERGLLVSLAEKLAPAQPGNAVALYQRVLPSVVEETSNAAYGHAIALIRAMGVLMREQNQLPQFREYLEQLRAQFKPKRNFIKLLDEVARAAAT